MLYYKCSKCGETFSALNPKTCPYCQHDHLQILSNYRVQVYTVPNMESKDGKYAVKFDLHSDTHLPEDIVSETICKILRLPSISIRHCINNPYISRLRTSRLPGNKLNFETPFTVELRLYSPQRAYVLLDSEDDEIFDYLVDQYTAMNWKVLDLRKSQISFVQIIKQYLKTNVIPRIKNNVIRKDIECIVGTY